MLCFFIFRAVKGKVIDLLKKKCDRENLEDVLRELGWEMNCVLLVIIL